MHIEIFVIFAIGSGLLTGKGTNYMFWDWELFLADSFAVTVKSTYNEINYKYFEGKKVNIKGAIFYGIIIGTSEGQNAKGFRIDTVEIEELKNY